MGLGAPVCAAGLEVLMFAIKDECHRAIKDECHRERTDARDLESKAVQSPISANLRLACIQPLA
jgi:hypothetical protein